MQEVKIKTVGGNGTFEDVVSKSSPDIQEIAYALRQLLANIMPGITEVPWAQQEIAGYGVGVKKMSEHFCYLAPYKRHVNLGFNYGAELPDSENLLVGSGKLLRHIKFKSLDELENPAIRKLIEDASVHLPELES